MILVNLTPHSIRLRADTNNAVAEAAEGDIVIPPQLGEDGKPAPARVSATPGKQPIGFANGVALYGATSYSEVAGLPDPQADTNYIVSALVGGRVSKRPDVFQPGTGPRDGAIRTSDGQVFAVTRLNQAG